MVLNSSRQQYAVHMFTLSRCYMQALENSQAAVLTQKADEVDTLQLQVAARDHEIAQLQQQMAKLQSPQAIKVRHCWCYSLQ